MSAVKFTWLGKSNLLSALIFALVLLWVGPLFSAAAVIVETLIVPREVAAAHGNTSADPFFFTEPRGEVQTYFAKAFADAGADIVEITGVAFRVDQSASSLDAFLPRVKLSMAVTPPGTVEPGRLPGAVVLYDHENVRLTAPRPGATPQFNIRFTFDRPFTYDRNRGDLSLRFESMQTFGNGAAMDAHFSDTGAYFLYQTDDRLVSVSQTIVTEFMYVAIPEPRPLVLWVLGASAIAFIVRGRKEFR